MSFGLWKREATKVKKKRRLEIIILEQQSLADVPEYWGDRICKS